MAETLYKIGDVVEFKKKHPCGSSEWKIHRMGMDFGLVCMGCGHYVLIPRVKFLKAVKKIIGVEQDS